MHGKFLHISVVKQNIYIPFKNVHIEIIQSSAFLNPVTFNQSWQKSFLRKGLSILFKWRTWSTTSSRYHNCNYFYHITLHRKTIFKIILYFSWQKIRRKCYLLPISPANTKRTHCFVFGIFFSKIFSSKQVYPQNHVFSVCM